MLFTATVLCTITLYKLQGWWEAPIYCAILMLLISGVFVLVGSSFRLFISGDSPKEDADAVDKTIA